MTDKTKENEIIEATQGLRQALKMIEEIDNTVHTKFPGYIESDDEELLHQVAEYGTKLLNEWLDKLDRNDRTSFMASLACLRSNVDAVYGRSIAVAFGKHGAVTVENLGNARRVV